MMDLLELPESTREAGFLAWDEALLMAAEAGERSSCLWFWESPQPWVVLGCGQKAALEANLDACRESGVPVLRRCSGGGAVLQGPGCLNYAVVLRIDAHADLTTIHGTNSWILERQRRALSRVTGQSVTLEGHTDLALEGRKFSGNAQRRKRSVLLFHGTVLHHFDLTQLARFLRFPSAQPDYRAGRPHLDFVRNLHCDATSIREAICQEWEAKPSNAELPLDRFEEAMEQRYRRTEWHLRS